MVRSTRVKCVSELGSKRDIDGLPQTVIARQDIRPLRRCVFIEPYDAIISRNRAVDRIEFEFLRDIRVDYDGVYLW